MRTISAPGGKCSVPSLPLCCGSFVRLFASVVFGITMRDTPRKMLHYGAYCFILFVGSAVVLSWVMYFIAR